METICCSVSYNMPTPRPNSSFTWEDYYRIKENAEKAEREYREHQIKEFLEKHGREPKEDEILHLTIDYA